MTTKTLLIAAGAVVVWIAGTYAFVFAGHYAPCGYDGCGEGIIEVFSGLFAVAWFMGVPVLAAMWIYTESGD